MPLLLLDLDSTLIDRAAAFRRWAVSFAASAGASAKAAGWLIMTGREEADVLVEPRRGFVENIERDPAVPAALCADQDR